MGTDPKRRKEPVNGKTKGMDGFGGAGRRARFGVNLVGLGDRLGVILDHWQSSGNEEQTVLDVTSSNKDNSVQHGTSGDEEQTVAHGTSRGKRGSWAGTSGESNIHLPFV